MMIVMKPTATVEEVEAVVQRVHAVGARAHVINGEELTVIGAIGDSEHMARLALDGAPGVGHMVPISKPYKLASSQITHGARSVLDIAGRRVGGDHFTMIAGPCTIESRDQTLVTADTVAAAGATMLRGGAYKPRTSPYAFQGLGEEGLRAAGRGAKAQTGLPIVTEVMDARDVELVLEVRRHHPDRRAQHAELHAAVGDRPRRQPRPAQARALQHAGGAADGGRVHAHGGQPAT